MTRNCHIPDLTTLEKQLNTDLSEGLTARAARERLEKEQKHKNRWSLFVMPKTPMIISLLSFIASPFAVLLIIMSLLVALFGDPLLGFAVLIITVAATVFGGIMSAGASHRLESMREYASPMVTVKRGGNLFKTDGRNIVVGDVIFLKTGDLLPCDARLIKTNALVVEEIFSDKNGISKRRLAKKADSFYDETSDVTDPDAVNMLYAGSAIVEGTAMAVVCATGADVYLAGYMPEGALGGRDTESEGVKNLRPIFFRASFICASALLMLSLIGLLTLRGKESFICVFTMLLSAVCFVTSILLVSGTREIFASYIKRLSVRRGKKRRDYSAAIRNLRSLDTLSGVTDLVLVGNAGLCEGMFHISSAYCSAGVVKELVPDDKGARLLTLVHTYLKAQKESGVENSFTVNGYADALTSHLRSSGFDINGASLAIKSLYFAHGKIGETDFACAETDSDAYKVSLTFNEKLLSGCSLIRDGDSIREMYDDDLQNIIVFLKNATAQGVKPMFVYTESDGALVFEGIIAFDQLLDESIVSVVDTLSSLNIKTTILLANDDEHTRKMIEDQSVAPLFTKVAFASQFRKSGKSITDGLGDYSAYIGFKKEEYEELLIRMRKLGSRIAAYGVDNDSNIVLARADIAISCDVLNYASEKYRESVYEKVPPEGRDTNIRCSQQTRLLSKIIVKRVHENGGGMTSILQAFRVSRSAYVAIAQSLTLFIMLMSTLLSISAMSVLTGNMLLDPIQTISLSSVFAILSICVFSEAKHKDKILCQKRDFTMYPIEMIYKRLPGIIARVSVSVLLAVGIKILDAVGVFGNKPSYTLPVFVCLCVTLFAEVFISNHIFARNSDSGSLGWLKVMIAYAVLLGICAVTTQYPFADKLFANGFGTLEYLIVPAYAVLYVIALLIVHFIDKRAKTR